MRAASPCHDVPGQRSSPPHHTALPEPWAEQYLTRAVTEDTALALVSTAAVGSGHGPSCACAVQVTHRPGGAGGRQGKKLRPRLQTGGPVQRLTGDPVPSERGTMEYVTLLPRGVCATTLFPPLCLNAERCRVVGNRCPLALGQLQTVVDRHNGKVPSVKLNGVTLYSSMRP